MAKEQANRNNNSLAGPVRRQRVLAASAGTRRASDRSATIWQ